MDAIPQHYSENRRQSRTTHNIGTMLIYGSTFANAIQSTRNDQQILKLIESWKIVLWSKYGA